MSKTSAKAWDGHLFKRVLATSKPHRNLLNIGLFLTVFLAVLSPLRPYIIGKLVGKYVFVGDASALLNGTLLVVGILFIESLMLIALSYLSSDLGQRVVKDLRDKLFEHIRA